MNFVYFFAYASSSKEKVLEVFISMWLLRSYNKATYKVFGWPFSRYFHGSFHIGLKHTR